MKQRSCATSGRKSRVEKDKARLIEFVAMLIIDHKVATKAQIGNSEE